MKTILRRVNDAVLLHPFELKPDGLEWIYNTLTLGAPAVHHSRFAQGGLARMKANVIESNKRLRFLQEKLQDVLILNGDIDDALDHLTHIIESPSTNIERSVLKSSLQRVVKAVSRSIRTCEFRHVDVLLGFLLAGIFEQRPRDDRQLHWTNDCESVDISQRSTGSICLTRTSEAALGCVALTSFAQDAIYGKAKKLLDEIKQSLEKDEQTFGMPQLNNLKSTADELERHTCKHIMRYIFQEGMDIERYPEAFRERFDIAFSQAVMINTGANADGRVLCRQSHCYSFDVVVFLVDMPHILRLRTSLVSEN